MISIAMTTYNGEKYLREQLDSILSQTFTNWELHACDDCSNDNTFEILQEYESKDSRIHVHRNESNLGFKKNFERAITFCSGEYIAFADQDDVWNNNKLEKCFYELENSQYDFVCSDARFLSEEGMPLGLMSSFLKLHNTPAEKKEIFIHLLHYNFVQGSTMLLRTKFVKRCLPFPDVFTYHDWYLALCATVGNGFLYIKDPLMFYRQHREAVTGDKVKGVSFFEKVKRFKMSA